MLGPKKKPCKNWNLSQTYFLSLLKVPYFNFNFRGRVKPLGGKARSFNIIIYVQSEILRAEENSKQG